MSSLKAVLFDMDDTLLDWSRRSGDWASHERAHLQHVFDYVVETIQPIFSPVADFFDEVRRISRQAWLDAEYTYHAPHYGEALLMAFDLMGVPRAKLDINVCLRRYDWQVASGVTCFPDVPEALAALQQQGIAMGVVTNASVPMWMRDQELAAFNLLNYFGACRFAAADVGFIKPHQAIFRAALDCLGVSPSEVVFVGDNPVADVAGAQKMGMRAVLRLLDHRPPMVALGEIVPDGEIKTLLDLLPLFDDWYPGWR
ncbi:MAG TPA: HAD family hydrolase [Aggregatilineales bacterium]|nr:HAD family hydrolase [Anaerolineales bacterium]HRE47349.1 HAD family hydrolase [Aggregatilineales bacterium]